MCMGDPGLVGIGAIEGYALATSMYAVGLWVVWSTFPLLHIILALQGGRRVMVGKAPCSLLPSPYGLVVANGGGEV